MYDIDDQQTSIREVLAATCCRRPHKLGTHALNELEIHFTAWMGQNEASGTRNDRRYGLESTHTFVHPTGKQDTVMIFTHDRDLERQQDV